MFTLPDSVCRSPTSSPPLHVSLPPITSSLPLLSSWSLCRKLFFFVVSFGLLSSTNSYRLNILFPRHYPKCPGVSPLLDHVPIRVGTSSFFHHGCLYPRLGKPLIYPQSLHTDHLHRPYQDLYNSSGTRWSDYTPTEKEKK